MARQPRLPACWVENCYRVCTDCPDWEPRLTMESRESYESQKRELEKEKEGNDV